MSELASQHRNDVNRNDVNSNDVVLEARGLHVEFTTAKGALRAVAGADLVVRAGETVAIVGESGSGKSTVAHAAIGLLPTNGWITGGRLRVDGIDVQDASPKQWQKLRGRTVGLIPQDPMVSLNPVHRVGDQVAETLLIHRLAPSADAAKTRAIALLDAVGIPDAARRARQYPHEFSGGMRQRVLIAIALAGSPKLLIADEPTSALDVTVQKQVLDHLGELARTAGTATVLITHDLALAAERAQRVVVMYAGRTVESGPAATLLADPRHPYTAALLASAPSLATATERLAEIPGTLPSPYGELVGCAFADRCSHATEQCRRDAPPAREVEGTDGHLVACWLDDRANVAPVVLRTSRRADVQTIDLRADGLRADGLRADDVRPGSTGEPLVSVENLRRTFRLRAGIGRRHVIHAVDDVSFSIGRGETLGLVGESGSGKSTAARLVLRLLEPSGGRVVFDGIDLATLDAAALRRLRARFQPVFQDPFASLDPRFTIEEVIEEPLRAFGIGDRSSRRARVRELLDQVALPEAALERRPAELSGGQRQRVAIARALTVTPDLIVCDEPVSALDVSVQAQILNLLKDLQERNGISLLFISHDLSVVRQIAHRVCVMQSGRLVEAGPVEDIFERPSQPYTQQLLAAIPRPTSGSDLLETPRRNEPIGASS